MWGPWRGLDAFVPDGTLRPAAGLSRSGSLSLLQAWCQLPARLQKRQHRPDLKNFSETTGCLGIGHRLVACRRGCDICRSETDGCRRHATLSGPLRSGPGHRRPTSHRAQQAASGAAQLRHLSPSSQRRRDICRAPKIVKNTQETVLMIFLLARRLLYDFRPTESEARAVTSPVPAHSAPAQNKSNSGDTIHVSKSPPRSALRRLAPSHSRWLRCQQRRVRERQVTFDVIGPHEYSYRSASNPSTSSQYATFQDSSKLWNASGNRKNAADRRHRRPPRCASGLLSRTRRSVSPTRSSCPRSISQQRHPQLKRRVWRSR